MKGLVFLLILKVSANVGMEPFNLKVQVQTHKEAHGQICIQIEEQGLDFFGEQLTYAKSCWVAEQQAVLMTRTYILVPAGDYLVKGWVDTKLGASPITVKVTCTESGNESNIPKCP